MDEKAPLDDHIDLLLTFNDGLAVQLIEFKRRHGLRFSEEATAELEKMIDLSQAANEVCSSWVEGYPLTVGFVDEHKLRAV